MEAARKAFITVPVFVAAMGVSPAIHAADPGEAIDDATIATHVRAGIIADPALQLSLVRVYTDSGTVELNGIVRSKDQEDEAVKITHQTEGVTAVQDNIEVRSY